MNASSRRGQQGVALLEALIAILIFSIGLLGIVAMQAKGQQFSVDSEDRTRAALLASDLVNKMWEAKSTTIASADYTAWQSSVSATGSGLVNGAGTYSVDTSSGVATVTITWKAPWRKSTEQSNTYTTQVQIP
jgi:type IV pilus assembly protein PilV